MLGGAGRRGSVRHCPTYIHSGPDLGKKLDEAGISAAKRPGGAGGEAGGKFRWGEAPSR